MKRAVLLAILLVALCVEHSTARRLFDNDPNEATPTEAAPSAMTPSEGEPSPPTVDGDPGFDPPSGIVGEPEPPVPAPVGDPIDDPIDDPLDDPIDDPLDDPIDDPADDPLNEPFSETPSAAPFSPVASAETEAPVASDFGTASMAPTVDLFNGVGDESAPPSEGSDFFGDETAAPVSSTGDGDSFFGDEPAPSAPPSMGDGGFPAAKTLTPTAGMTFSSAPSVVDDTSSFLDTDAPTTAAPTESSFAFPTTAAPTEGSFAFPTTSAPATKAPVVTPVTKTAAPVFEVVEPPVTSAPVYSFTEQPVSAFKFTMAPSTMRPTDQPVTYTPKDVDEYMEEEDKEIEEEEGWFNKGESFEELPHDKNVLIVVGVLVGVFLLLAILTAHQMLNNPDGICASLCRLSVTCTCCIFKALCFPCRMLCCANGPRHTPISTDAGYSHDLELS